MPRLRPGAAATSDIITLLTDFGTRDAFVGIMKGVILRLNPNARLVDLTHDIEPQDVLAGALLLRSAVPYFPAGTVHLAVVDPGVGSSRKGLVITAGQVLLVGPDNGLLQPAAERLGILRIYAIDLGRLGAEGRLPGPPSQTFHGRDVFAPVAGLVSAGLALHRIGSVTRKIVDLHIPPSRTARSAISGEVIHVDRFGNLITNIASAELARLSRSTRAAPFPERRLSISIGGTKIRGLVPAYAAAPRGTLLAIVGSWDMLEVSVSGGSAARQLAITRGTPVHVTLPGVRGQRTKEDETVS